MQISKPTFRRSLACERDLKFKHYEHKSGIQAEFEIRFEFEISNFPLTNFHKGKFEIANLKLISNAV